MSVDQIREQLFSNIARQNVSRRLIKLEKYGLLERARVRSFGFNDLSVYLNTPKAIREMRLKYPYRITKELCKSDSIVHDIELVNLRSSICKLQSVTRYFTENMLQACEDFSYSDQMVAFVKNNTDVVLEISKSGKRNIVGLEFERSDKAFDRYTKKIFSYYSDTRTAIILYVCASPAILKLVSRAEASVMGSSNPRCFYALQGDVLKSNQKCTFTNQKGGTITIG